MTSIPAQPSTARPAAPAPRRGALAGLAAATPAGRDRYADFLRVASMLVVVLGHWLMTAVVWDDGTLTGTNILAVIPGLWLATWVFQVIPVFFVVGGFANLRAVESLQRRGGSYAEFLTGRARRLLRPTAVFVAFWLAVGPLLTLAGVPADQVRLVGHLLPQPLWFLATYLMVVALAPVMVRLHQRYRLRALVGLGVAAALVDVARFSLDLPDLGYLNLLLVWLAVHQLGFLYADGTLARLSRRALLAVAAAGLGTLAVLTGSGVYPPSMVTLPGATASNMNPPTVCMLALALWQVALLLMARGPMNRWLAGARPWAAVVGAGSLSMSVYLWHMTALVGLLGVVLATGLPLPAPGSAAWWLSRPLWLAALVVFLAPLLLVFGRWERPPAARPAGAAPGARGAPVAAVAGLVYAVLGVFGFVTGGFAPLPDPDGSPLLVLQVDPLQSAVCLALGLGLLRAARTGAAATPTPWLWAAVAAAALLTPLIPGVAGSPAQLVATAPANGLLHGTLLAVAAGTAWSRWAAQRTTRTGRTGSRRPQPGPGAGAEEPSHAGGHAEEGARRR